MDATRARYYDVRARAWCSFLRAHPLASAPSSPPVSILHPIGITLASVPLHARARLSSAPPGRPVVSVTWTLCETASIKPHFYSGTLHSLRPVRFPTHPPPLSVARLPPTFYGPARVRAHPAVSRCIHCGVRTRGPDISARVYIHNGRKGKREPRFERSDSGDFYGSILCECALRPNTAKLSRPP